jgi:hypothetical protein
MTLEVIATLLNSRYIRVNQPAISLEANLEKNNGDNTIWIISIRIFAVDIQL